MDVTEAKDVTEDKEEPQRRVGSPTDPASSTPTSVGPLSCQRNLRGGFFFSLNVEDSDDASREESREGNLVVLPVNSGDERQEKEEKEEEGPTETSALTSCDEDAAKSWHDLGLEVRLRWSKLPPLSLHELLSLVIVLLIPVNILILDLVCLDFFRKILIFKQSLGLCRKMMTSQTVSTEMPERWVSNDNPNSPCSMWKISWLAVLLLWLLLPNGLIIGGILANIFVYKEQKPRSGPSDIPTASLESLRKGFLTHRINEKELSGGGVFTQQDHALYPDELTGVQRTFCSLWSFLKVTWKDAHAIEGHLKFFYWMYHEIIGSYIIFRRKHKC
ncbi:unnamed protein product [Phytomonas sp. Hart1]|nr:unnamed protein product [Phytomonas sp. Hart1]|eukprot:CCW69736.1 unnamed protein product [Phytomonas sp. isolate Hart1]